MTIREILDHPDYRRFAREVTECGRQIVPDVFPWRLMGMSDEELMTAELRFDQGNLIAPHLRYPLIVCVRHNEELVIEHWDWWQEHRQPDPASREAAVAALNPCRPGVQQGFLW